jgi:radical SAM-linked protein
VTTFRTPAAPNDAISAAASRARVVVEYAIGGDLRFLSHLDEIRMLTRALVRARWPLAYSQGFNPIPRLSIPLPRYVGLASLCQLAMIELSEPRSGAELEASLAAALPADCLVRRVGPAASRRAPQPLGATFEIPIEAADAEIVARTTERLRASRPENARDLAPDADAARTVDPLDSLTHVSFDGRVLRLRQRYSARRRPRPTELLKEFGLAPEVYGHLVVRTETDWDRAPLGDELRPANSGKELT